MIHFFSLFWTFRKNNRLLIQFFFFILLYCILDNCFNTSAIRNFLILSVLYFCCRYCKSICKKPNFKILYVIIQNEFFIRNKIIHKICNYKTHSVDYNYFLLLFHLFVTQITHCNRYDVEMLDKARDNAEKHGYKNVVQTRWYWKKISVEDNSVDVVTSNCVINLTSNKVNAFKEVHRILKQIGDGKMIIRFGRRLRG